MKNDDLARQLQQQFQSEGYSPARADLKAMGVLQQAAGVSSLAIAAELGCEVHLRINGTPEQVKRYMETIADLVEVDLKVIWAHHPGNLECLRERAPVEVVAPKQRRRSKKGE